MPKIKFAIIADNILTCLGLKSMMEKMMPIAEIEVCESFAALEKLEAEEFMHFFVSSRIYFENAQWFKNHPHKSIVLVNGSMSINDVFTLNVCQNESGLIKDILALQNRGHALHHNQQNNKKDQILSPREIEVAILLCKGLINKEIADKMNIALATVVSHRKNIMDKLHAHSLVDIIVHCVVNGIVNIEEL